MSQSQLQPLEKCNLLEMYSLLEFMTLNYGHDSNFHFIGANGIGKRSIIKQFFRENAIVYIELNIMVLSSKRFKETLIEFLEYDNDKKAIIFNYMNEINEDLIPMVLELIEYRRIETYQFKKDVCIICLNNDFNMTSNSKKIFQPLMNMIFTYEIEPHIKDFFNYLNGTIHFGLKAYLTYFPDNLYKKDTMLSPISWEKINIILNNIEKNGEFTMPELHIIFSSILGKKESEKFINFIQTKDLRNYITPNPLLNFETAIPKEPIIDENVDMIIRKGYIYNLRDNSLKGQFKRNFYNFLIFLKIMTPDKIRKNNRIK